MSFNTLLFVGFIIPVLILYWEVFAPRSVNWRNAFLLIASYVFYGAWDWRFLGLIVFSSGVDFVVGRQLGIERNTRTRKALLGLSLAVNLGLLGIFKYLGFFSDSLQDLLGWFGMQADVPTLNLLLPVGISFYTFQTLGYTIDVYRKQLEPEQNPLTFFTYVAFFPQLVAGPIERASRLLPQLNRAPSFDEMRVRSGLRLILWGYFKKVVIADNLAYYVDPVFASPEGVGWIPSTIAVIAFSFQIYGDFSGYSDIAIGLSRLMGIELMTNFRAPYRAASMREFWQRWHISLSTWFRDYLYIPLGGNRKGSARTSLNIFLTFTISGLWHGAHITFVVWGMLHGFALLIERQLSKFVRVPRQLAILLVGLFAGLCWIPFRAANWLEAKEVTTALFRASPDGWNQLMDQAVLRDWMVLGSLLLLMVVDAFADRKTFDEWVTGALGKTWMRWIFYGLLVQLFIMLGRFSEPPQFIYFQF